jgi:hypothetical protein
MLPRARVGLIARTNMNSFHKLLLAGAATGLTATAALAATAHHHRHHPPIAAFVPGGNLDYAVFTAPISAAYVVPAAPDAMVAQMDRVMAQMNQMAAAMDQQMMQVFAQGSDMDGQDQLMNAVLHDTSGATDDSTLDAALKSGNACMQSVSITERPGVTPQVISHSYGNCGAVSGSEASTPAMQPAQPGLIEASLLMGKHKHGHHPV